MEERLHKLKCRILYNYGGILSRSGDVDCFRDNITSKTSPFVASLKTNFISIGLMSFPLQQILALNTFGRGARRVDAMFVRNV